MPGPEKPRKPYQALGDEAKVEVKRLERDEWARQTLQDIGKAFSRPGMKYLGSAAFHVYAVGSELLIAPKEVSIISQVHLGNVSEMSAEFATREFVKRVRAAFTREPRSIDPNYKVESGL